jgi:hypothetical protein
MFIVANNNKKLKTQYLEKAEISAVFSNFRFLGF